MAITYFFRQSSSGPTSRSIINKGTCKFSSKRRLAHFSVIKQAVEIIVQMVSVVIGWVGQVAIIVEVAHIHEVTLETRNVNMLLHTTHTHVISHPFTKGHIRFKAIAMILWYLISLPHVTQPCSLYQYSTADERNVPHTTAKRMEHNDTYRYKSFVKLHGIFTVHFHDGIRQRLHGSGFTVKRVHFIQLGLSFTRIQVLNPSTFVSGETL